MRPLTASDLQRNSIVKRKLVLLVAILMLLNVAQPAKWYACISFAKTLGFANTLISYPAGGRGQIRYSSTFYRFHLLHTKLLFCSQPESLSLIICIYQTQEYILRQRLLLIFYDYSILINDLSQLLVWFYLLYKFLTPCTRTSMYFCHLYKYVLCTVNLQLLYYTIVNVDPVLYNYWF